MSILPRVLLAGFALALTTACEPSLETACQGFCDKAMECSSEVSEADVNECKGECTESQLEAERLLERGDLTDECYDAVRDTFDCANGLSCSEFESNDPPPECRDAVERVERDCDD